MSAEQILAAMPPQWVNFMFVENPNKDKPDKVPINPHTLYGASSTNPQTWGTLQQAAAQIGKTGSCKRKDGISATAPIAGVGFVFNGGGIVGIDFDHCIENGQLAPWVAEWVRRFDSYTEYSPSGTGIHILCNGSLGDRAAVKRPEVEIYDRARYFTVTGKPYGDAKPLRAAQTELDALYGQFAAKPKPAPPVDCATPTLDDYALVEKMRNAHNGAAFSALWAGDIAGYGSQSEADLALCNMLAFWTGHDTAQMDRIFRQSGLMRPKWDERHGRDTYGAQTVAKAAQECQTVYNPDEYRRATAAQDFVELPPKSGATDGNARKDTLALTVITASNLQVKDIPQIQFIVDNLLPQGLSLLASPPKYGKSWWVLALCLAVAFGEPFMGHQTNRTGCLYLALEDSERRLKFRMNKLLNGRRAPDNLHYATTAHDISNGLISELDDFIGKVPDAKLIVIDTLQKVRPPGNGKETAYSADYREVGALKRFADEKGVCVLLVHHLRKMQSPGDPFERISGTNGIMGAADTTMVMTRENRSDEDTLFSVVGRDVDSRDIYITFDKEQCRWTVKGDADWIAEQRARLEYQNSPIVKTVKKLLEQGGGKWSGSAQDLLTAGKFITQSYIANNARALTDKIKGLEKPLFDYDGIIHDRTKHGTGGGKHHFYYASVAENEFIELEPTQGEMPDFS